MFSPHAVMTHSLPCLRSSSAEYRDVNGRTRGTPKRRRSGPAELEAIKRIVQAIGIPVLTNGNVRTAADVRRNADYTKAHGVMCAEPLLCDPTLFKNAMVEPTKAARSWDIGAAAMQYLKLARDHPPNRVCGGTQCVRGHIQWMLGRQGRGDRTTFKFAGEFRHSIPALRSQSYS